MPEPAPFLGSNWGSSGFSRNRNNRGSSGAYVTYIYCSWSVKLNTCETQHKIVDAFVLHFFCVCGWEKPEDPLFEVPRLTMPLHGVVYKAWDLPCISVVLVQLSSPKLYPTLRMDVMSLCILCKHDWNARPVFSLLGNTRATITRYGWSAGAHVATRCDIRSILKVRWSLELLLFPLFVLPCPSITWKWPHQGSNCTFWEALISTSMHKDTWDHYILKNALKYRGTKAKIEGTTGHGPSGALWINWPWLIWALDRITVPFPCNSQITFASSLWSVVLPCTNYTQCKKWVLGPYTAKFI